MSDRLSTHAERIISAGLSAARDASDVNDRFTQADRAVADAIGNLCLGDPDKGEVLAVDSLTEIAQLLVREKVLQQA